MSTQQSEAFDYWAWARTAPKCEGCGHAFDIENAKQFPTNPDPTRFCCGWCAEDVERKAEPSRG